MAWQDRHYYRERPSAGMGPLMWLLAGSLPLFRAFGIEVRAHASLVILVVLGLLLNLSAWQIHATGLSLLFLSILLHEFGHCFATRAVGGTADNVLLWPLGGLAYTSPPQRPLPTFLSVAAGPATNLLLAALCIGLIWGIGAAPSNWGELLLGEGNWRSLPFYLAWFATINVGLLIFNLLPIYPLDGGQMLQAILWPMLGYTRSMIVSCWTGIFGSVGMALVGFMGNIWLVVLAISCLMTCLQRLAYTRAAAAEGTYDEPSYLSSAPQPTRHHRPGRLATWRARRRIREAQSEQTRVDAILEKVSHHGMHSLSWFERRALRKATDRQREREMEHARRRY